MPFTRFLHDRAWWRSTLVSLPWLSSAALLGLFWLLPGDSSIAQSSILYGLFKINLAVLLAWVADFSLNLGSPPQAAADKGNYIPQIRRALYFLGICWVMSVT